MRLSHIIYSLLLALTVVLPAQAAEDVTWYEIELILFKQGNADAGSEQWPEDPGSPDWNNLVSLQPAADGDPSQPYEILPESGWQLRALYNGLRRSGATEPLFHQAWRQPVVSSDSAARPIYLGPRLAPAQAGEPAPRFEGTLRISVNRYFHVNLDLLLLGANRAVPVTESALVASPTLGSIRFTARRRMRSGELHYIDHPMLGALIQISRIEPPAPEPEAAPATPLPTAGETAAGDDTPVEAAAAVAPEDESGEVSPQTAAEPSAE